MKLTIVGICFIMYKSFFNCEVPMIYLFTGGVVVFLFLGAVMRFVPDKIYNKIQPLVLSVYFVAIMAMEIPWIYFLSNLVVKTAKALS